MLLWFETFALIGLIIFLGNLFIESAVDLCIRFKISTFIMGLTVIAFGTSLPEIFVSCIASFDGHPEIVIGNTTGGCITNILIGIGLVAVFFPFELNKDVKTKKNVLFMVFSQILFSILIVISSFVIGKFLACILLSLFGLFIFLNIKEHRDEAAEYVYEEHKYKYIIIPIILFIGSIIGLGLVSDLLVKCVSNIARSFNISEKVIAGTIVAIGTSTPEIITSFVAVRKKQTDLIIGNIVGSNIFLTLAVFGSSALFGDIPLSPRNYLINLLPAVLISLIFYMIFKISNKITRAHGVILTFLYSCFVVFQFFLQ